MGYVYLRCCVVADDLAQTFASVSEETGENANAEIRPNEAAPSLQQQFSSLPASSSQGEVYPPGTMTNIYAPKTAPAVYPSGSAPMQSSMMVGPARDFNQIRSANFQGTWQPGPGTELSHMSSGVPPPSSGMPPHGELRPEFHPNLESGAAQDPCDGNLPA